MVLHKSPSAKILELSDTTGDISDLFYDKETDTFFKSKTGDVSYTIGRKKPKHDTEASKLSTNYATELIIDLDQKNEADENSKAQKYDIVMVGASLLRDSAVKEKLDRCKDFLTP